VNRDFRRVWLGETVSTGGSAVTTVALPLVAVVGLHAGPMTTGVLTAASWLPWVVLGLPAGAWVDRLRRRPLLLGADLAAAGLLASVPVAAWLGVLGTAQLLVVALLTGVTSVVFGLAYRAWLPGLVPPAELDRANARLQGSASVAQLAGRGLAGILAQGLGAVTGVLADAVSFVVSAACLAGVRVREARPVPPARRNLRAEIAEGVRLVAGDGYLRALTLFAAIGNAGLTGYQAVQVPFLIGVLRVPAVAVGVLVAVSSAGAVLGAVLAGPLGRWLGTARAIRCCAVAGSPFAVLIPLAGPGAGVVLQIAGMFGLGVEVAVINVIAAGFRQTYPPARLRGRVIAAGALAGNGTGPVGAVLAGAIGGTAGVRAAVWAMIGLVVLSALPLCLGALRRNRDLPPTRTDDAKPEHFTTG
jgi:MFS family permease